MVENHTRDLLQMKAKETQLARSRNDAELTQAALSKAQRDLEEFIKGLDDDTQDSEIVSQISSRCKDLEDQNRRLLSQMEEYSTRITTLEDVYHPQPRKELS